MDDRDLEFFEKVKRQNLAIAAVCAIGLAVMALIALIVF